VITRDRLLDVLSRHVGAVHGCSIEQLTYEVTCAYGSSSYPPSEGKERKMRQLVSDLREEGIAVCAHPKTGYFIAETAAELEACCNFLRSRAMHSLTLESRLRKIALGELLGQLRITA